MPFHGSRLSGQDDEYVLEVDGGDGCKRVYSNAIDFLFFLERRARVGGRGR